MQSRFSREAARRDEELVIALCHSIHRNLRRELHEWLQEELIALINAAQLQELELGSPVAEAIRDKIGRLQTINGVSLPNALGAYSKVVSDVSNEAWSDVHDAYVAMQRECTVLVNIMEELVAVRKLIEPMMTGTDGEDESDDG